MKSNARRGAPVKCGPYGSRKTRALPKRRKVYVFVRPGFEGLKIISAGKDGGREGVSLPHGDKRISERSGPALF